MLRRLGRVAGRYAGLIKGVAAALAVLAVVLFARSLPAERPLEWLTNRVEALGVWGTLLFAALFVLATVLLLPATPITIAAGAVFGPLEAAVVISLASTASAAVSFLASRYLARERVARRVARYRKLGAVYRALGKRGGWKVVVAVRLAHALPFGVQNLFFGLTPIRLGPFLAATWAAMLPGTVLYAYLGHLGAAALGGEPSAGAVPWPVKLLGLLAAAAALLYVAHVARRAIREEAGVDLSKDVAAEALAAEPPRTAWPWGALAALLTAVLLAAAGAWSYAERDKARQAVERWFP